MQKAILQVLVLRWFILRRRQFSAILHSSGAGMSQRRYFRLMALASVEIILSFPASLYVFISNATQKLQPFVDWKTVHEGFGFINHYSIEDVPARFAIPMQVGRWTGVGAAFVFLCFFTPSQDVSESSTCLVLNTHQLWISDIQGVQVAFY